MTMSYFPTNEEVNALCESTRRCLARQKSRPWGHKARARARATGAILAMAGSPSAPAPTAASVADGYAALSYAQRARLAKSDPKLFAAARAAHQARREKLASDLAKAPTLAARAPLLEELAKL